MKVLRNILAFLILSNIGPCLVWASWNYDYVPVKGIDTFINSFHPYFAGWIGNFFAAGVVGVILLCCWLIDPSEFEKEESKN